MSVLPELLGSRTRAGILATLYTAPNAEIHLNQLSKDAGVGPRAVQQEVSRLIRLGLIRERRSGNRRYFQAETSHPAFRALSDLIRVTAGAEPILRTALQGDYRIRLALLFGSVALGSEDNESDVDLLVVGDLGLADLLEMVSPAKESLGRTINPVLMSEQEFDERRARGEHFVTRVLQSHPLALVGSLDDAADLAGKPLGSQAPDE